MLDCGWKRIFLNQVKCYQPPPTLVFLTFPSERIGIFFCKFQAYQKGSACKALNFLIPTKKRIFHILSIKVTFKLFLVSSDCDLAESLIERYIYSVVWADINLCRLHQIFTRKFCLMHWPESTKYRQNNFQSKQIFSMWPVKWISKIQLQLFKYIKSLNFMRLINKISLCDLRCFDGNEALGDWRQLTLALSSF